LRISFERIAHGRLPPPGTLASRSSHGTPAVPGSELEDHLRGTAKEHLHLHRHQQAEQRTTDLVVGMFVVRGRRHQPAQQRPLRGLRTYFSACALGVERIRDERVAAAVWSEIAEMRS
jgi:hypothetical protein